MSKVHYLCIALLSVVCNIVSAAGDSSGTGTTRILARSISFNDALERAFRNSPKLRKSNAAIEIAIQEWIGARSAFLPRLDISSTTQNIEALDGLPGLESLLLGGRNDVYHATTGIRLSLNAYNGGAEVAGMRIAAEGIQEAKLQRQLQRAAIALVILEHVHSVRLCEIDLRIALLKRGLSEKRLEKATSGLLTGTVSALSLAEAQYEFKSTELLRDEKKRAYHHAFHELAAAVGGEGESLTWPQSFDESRGYDEVLARHGLESTSAARETAIHESRIRAAQMEIKRTRSGYLPKIDFFYQTDYAAITESGYDTVFNNQRKDKRFTGVTLTWNLFDGFATTARVNAAAQRILTEQAELDIAVEEQRKKLADVMRRLKDSEEERLIESKRLELLQMKRDISREKLVLGRLDPIEFKAVETELEVQKLGLERCSEQVAFYEAKLLLQERQ